MWCREPLLVAFLCCSVAGKGNHGGPFLSGNDGPLMELATFDQAGPITTYTENPRLISALLAVALGPFGGHRLYLGTRPLVPIVYTLTLGGGFGVLPLIDLLHILFSKDLGPYQNNSSIFMWSGRKPNEEVTPP